MRASAIFLAGALTSMATTPLVVSEPGQGSATAFSAGSAAGAPTESGTRSGAQRSDNGLFYIDGKLAAGSIRFLVDTGASHVVLSHADARKLGGYVATGDTQAVLTAAGPVAVDWIVIREIKFDGHPIRNLKAAVPRRDVGVSLLGQNALAQFDSIHIDGDRLTLTR
ncbi:hypothetical protein GCM10009115_05820 [Sphingopyxis soli]|uniref:Peptidase A2 domain-containing protein n=2 Tax=Sphingopyxis soli TaxID=592051 RepID=A0ABP3XDW6_9SPHN|nr:retropepsin-like aspartic protease [Sphingopyxis soli]